MKYIPVHLFEFAHIPLIDSGKRKRKENTYFIASLFLSFFGTQFIIRQTSAHKNKCSDAMGCSFLIASSTVA